DISGHSEADESDTENSDDHDSYLFHVFSILQSENVQHDKSKTGKGRFCLRKELKLKISHNFAAAKLWDISGKGDLGFFGLVEIINDLLENGHFFHHLIFHFAFVFNFDDDVG